MRAGFAAFLVRHPLFATAVAMAACVAVADHSILAACGLAGLLGGLGWWSGCWRRGLAWVVCGCLAVGIFGWRNHRRDHLEAALLATGSSPAVGRALENGTGPRNTWSVPVKLRSGPQAGAIVLWQGDGLAPVAGSVVSAAGKFLPLPVTRNPGEFDHGRWLRRQGVAAVFQANEGQGSVTTSRLAALGARIRQAFRAAVTAGLPDDSQAAMIIRAVVIGEQPPDADELIAAFRNSGTLHIFSVSGMHVAMVASIGWLVLRGFRVPRPTRRCWRRWARQMTSSRWASSTRWAPAAAARRWSRSSPWLAAPTKIWQPRRSPRWAGSTPKLQSQPSPKRVPPCPPS